MPSLPHFAVLWTLNSGDCLLHKHLNRVCLCHLNCPLQSFLVCLLPFFLSCSLFVCLLYFLFGNNCRFPGSWRVGCTRRAHEHFSTSPEEAPCRGRASLARTLTLVPSRVYSDSTSFTRSCLGAYVVFMYPAVLDSLVPGTVTDKWMMFSICWRREAGRKNGRMKGGKERRDSCQLAKQVNR